MLPKREALLGLIAVEKGFLTETQLQGCLQELKEKAPSPAGEGEASRLGPLLLSKGYIKEDDLVALMDEREKRLGLLDAFQGVHRSELLFGQLLVKYNKATQIQINKCLEIQKRAAEQGMYPIPRLGELLTDHGFVDAQAVTEVLAMQNKHILFCTGCGKQFNVIGIEEGKTYRCKGCGGIMISKRLLESLRAEDTNFGFELPSNESEPGV